MAEFSSANLPLEEASHEILRNNQSSADGADGDEFSSSKSTRVTTLTDVTHSKGQVILGSNIRKDNKEQSSTSKLMLINGFSCVSDEPRVVEDDMLLNESYEV
jgi:hypothetical protein